MAKIIFNIARSVLLFVTVGNIVAFCAKYHNVCLTGESAISTVLTDPLLWMSLVLGYVLMEISDLK